MKKSRRLISLLLTVVLILSMNSVVFADEISGEEISTGEEASGEETEEVEAVISVVEENVQAVDKSTQGDAIEIGEDTSGFTIANCSICLTAGSVFKYTGSVIEPEVEVYTQDSEALVKDTDFTVSYTDNLNIGTATFTVTGAGKYTGSKSDTFYIVDPCTWAIPTITGVRVDSIPLDGDGNVIEGEGTATVFFTVDSRVNEAEFYGGINTSDGKWTGAELVGPATTSRPSEATSEYPENVLWVDDGNGGWAYTVHFATLGTGSEQSVMEEGGECYINGGAEGDTLTITATGCINTESLYYETDRSNAISFALTADSIGEMFTGEAVDERISLENATVTLSEKTYTYSGSACKPRVSVRIGGEPLSENMDFTVEYKDNKNAGSDSRVVIRGIGKYKGKKVVRFKITPKKVLRPKIKFSSDSCTYNGKVRKPGVEVFAGSKKLSTSDYKVTYTGGRMSVGQYTVKVTLKGNYSGTASKKFAIVPKKSKIASAKYDTRTRKLTIKWDRVSEKMISSYIDGYQIQIASDKKFSKNLYKKNIKGFKNNSFTVSAKKYADAGKYAYVRIRTYKEVGGKTLFSEWSSTKPVKLK